MRRTTCSRINRTHRCATLAKSAWGTALALIAVALLATPTQASQIAFFDDFEDDTVGGNPVIGSGDTGLSWDTEISPGVTVAANPNSTGNASATVLHLHHTGQMNGNFSAINFNEATLSMDFYLTSGLSGNKVGLKALRTDNTSAFGLNLKLSGEVGGGVFSTTHYGADVWQRAVWGFTYLGGDDWDVDLTFTNLDTLATTATETQTIALGAALSTEPFTAVGARGQGTGTFAGYVDNIQVVPEPTTALLLGLGLTGLGAKGRRRS